MVSVSRNQIVNMEEKIKQLTEGKDKGEIEELILDGVKGTSITGLTDDFVMLNYLSLGNIGLTSLDGLPSLPNLEELELSDNKLSEGFEILVKNCPRLCRLNLSGNRIKSISSLSCLKDLKSLINLDLFNCEVTLMINYREKMFSMFPKLMVLDGWDNMDKEVEDCEDESDVESDDTIENGVSFEDQDEDSVTDENSEEEDEDDEYEGDEEEAPSRKRHESENEEIPDKRQKQ